MRHLLGLSLLFLALACATAGPTKNVHWVPHSEDNVSDASAKRYSRRAWVKPGLPRDELIQELEAAAWSFYHDRQADAVVVFYYRDDNQLDATQLGAFTAGKVTIAPNGRWEEAGTPGPPRAVTEIRDDYFASSEEVIRADATIYVSTSEQDGTVPIYPVAMHDEKAAFLLEHGTALTVLDSQRLGGTNLISYRIKTVDGRTGWVDGFNVSTVNPLSQPRHELEPADASKAVRCDRFELEATLDGDTVLIRLTTDLPDSASLILSVDRLYWDQGNASAYEISYFSKRMSVAQLRRNLRVRVRDTTFQTELKKKQGLMRSLGEPFKVAKIDESIRVSGTVFVGQFGKRNENLIGSAVTASGSYRVVRCDTMVKKPLR